MLFQPATKGVVRYNVLSIERTLFPPKVPVLVTATVIAAAALLPEDHHCWRIPRCLWLHRHKVTEVVKSLEHGTVIVSIFVTTLFAELHKNCAFLCPSIA